MEYSEEAKERIAAEKSRRRWLELAVLLTVVSPFVPDVLGFSHLGPYAFALCLALLVFVILGGQIERLSERIDRK